MLLKLHGGDVAVLHMRRSGTSHPPFQKTLLKGVHMLKQACREQLSLPRLSLKTVSCVVSIYVGVSLQRSANEPLLSSTEGGAGAMLPGYW